MADASKINPIRIDKLGEANGVASLNSSGKVPDSQLPTKAINAVQKTGDTMTGTLQINSPSNEIRMIHPDYPEYNGFIRRSTQNFIIGTKDGTTGEWKRSIQITDNAIWGSTPAASANDNQIATTAWVTSKLSSVSSVGSKSIGEVFYSQSNNAEENPGSLPLWTGEYYSNASSLYPDFYNWVKSHTELCKTKTEYDVAISTYGECPYYVVDEIAGSLRLPKLVNYVKMANTVEGIKNIEAGLPDHTHELYTSDGYGNDGGNTKNQTGYIRDAVYKSQTGTSWVKNSSVYGKSDTVTPPSTTLYPWVYAFNSAVEASVAQASEFNQSLTQKANLDLSNVSQNIDYVVDSYSDEEGNWYRVYKSGWVEQGGNAATKKQVTFLKPYATNAKPLTITASPHDVLDQVLSIYSLTATGFNSVGRDTGGSDLSFSFYWQACGQGA